MKWFKTFEVDDRGVIFYLEPDGDDVILHQVTNEDDIFMDLKLIFNNDIKNNSRKAFDALDEQSARGALKQRDDMLKEVMKKLRTSRLKRDTIILLLHDATRVGKRDIGYVLNGLEQLTQTYLKPKIGGGK